MFCMNYWNMIKFIKDKNNFREDQNLLDSIGGCSKHKVLLQSEINFKIEKYHFSDNSDQLIGTFDKKQNCQQQHDDNSKQFHEFPFHSEILFKRELSTEKSSQTSYTFRSVDYN